MITVIQNMSAPWSCKILPFKSYHTVPEISICNADGQEFIRQSYDGYSDQASLSIGDAYLIAAAPEMLDALEKILRLRNGNCDQWTYKTMATVYGEQLDLIRKIAREAIAKAKGEAP